MTTEQLLAYIDSRIARFEQDTAFFLNDIEIGQLSAFQEIRDLITGESPDMC